MAYETQEQKPKNENDLIAGRVFRASLPSMRLRVPPCASEPLWKENNKSNFQISLYFSPPKGNDGSMQEGRRMEPAKENQNELLNWFSNK